MQYWCFDNRWSQKKWKGCKHNTPKLCTQYLDISQKERGVSRCEWTLRRCQYHFFRHIYWCIWTFVCYSRHWSMEPCYPFCFSHTKRFETWVCWPFYCCSSLRFVTRSSLYRFENIWLLVRMYGNSWPEGLFIVPWWFYIILSWQIWFGSRCRPSSWWWTICPNRIQTR